MLSMAQYYAAIQDLRANLAGEIICMGEDGYAAARKVWNGMIDRYPLLIARCANNADVMYAIRFAQSQQLPVSIRGGGHNVSGNALCDDGIVIDLSLMKGIHVDPVNQTVRAQAGLTLGEFVRATQQFGLGTTVGTDSRTGLAGLTLGGGLGWLMGKYGLTIDSLLSVDIITAGGHLLTASAGEHPDLFWGVRGGGGNFGVVTTFEFQLHPVGPLLAGKIVYPLSKAREVLRFYREYTSTAPDELTVYATLGSTPAGIPAVAIHLCYYGSLNEGERLIEPVRRFDAHLVDLVHPRSYFNLVSMADAGSPDGRFYYNKACTLKHPGDEAIDIMANYAAASTSLHSQVLIQHFHGAASRVTPTETAFALRDESYVISILNAWDGGEAERHIAWTRALWRALEPLSNNGVYVNFLGNEGEGRVRASYGPNYERLVELKNEYDPTNFFRFNQNIKPHYNTIRTGHLSR